MPDVIVGGIYRHYKKGTEYEVIGIARHSETMDELVVYKALYDSPDFDYGALWVRPKAMFMGLVEKDTNMVARFEYLGMKQ